MRTRRMRKVDALHAWRTGFNVSSADADNLCLFDVKLNYEQDGKPDYPARSESWNNFTDYLCKDGRITLAQYESWTCPRECGK